MSNRHRKDYLAQLNNPTATRGSDRPLKVETIGSSPCYTIEDRDIEVQAMLNDLIKEGYLDEEERRQSLLTDQDIWEIYERWQSPSETGGDTGRLEYFPVPDAGSSDGYSQSTLTGPAASLASAGSWSTFEDHFGPNQRIEYTNGYFTMGTKTRPTRLRLNTGRRSSGHHAPTTPSPLSGCCMLSDMNSLDGVSRQQKSFFGGSFTSEPLTENIVEGEESQAA